MTKNYFSDANAAIVVFDITAHETFEEAKRWIDDVKNNTSDDIVLAITGSKSDLDDQKAVSLKEYNELKKKYDAVGEETSSKTGVGVTELFN